MSMTFLEWLAQELASGRANIDAAEYYAENQIEIGFDEDTDIEDLTQVKQD